MDNPAHGSLRGSGANQTYIAYPDFSGSESFTLKANDGMADSAPATVSINVTAYTISRNAGVAGATLSFTDGAPKTITADGSGNYSFQVPINWSGTVTPSKAGYPSPSSLKPTLIPTTTTPTPPQAAGVCGQTGAWIVMVVGRSMHTQPGGTKSIRLVKVDFDQKRARIYSIPPDLALDTTGLIKDYNIKYSYLEDIFPKIVRAAGESDGADFKATQALAQVILDSFGIPADHYMTIDDTSLWRLWMLLVALMWSCLKIFPMPENSIYNGQVLKAGLQHFDGEMLHAYVSVIESRGGEFVRLSRQNVVLESLRKALMNPAILLKIIELYSVYKENVVTDLRLVQMTSLGCLVRLVPRNQIVMKEPAIDEILYWEDESMHFRDLDAEAQQLQELFGVKGP